MQSVQGIHDHCLTPDYFNTRNCSQYGFKSDSKNLVVFDNMDFYHLIRFWAVFNIQK